MKSILTIVCACTYVAIFAQDSTIIVKHFTYQGYIKNLQTLIFDKELHDMMSGDLLHNRLNFKWTPTKTVTIVSEFRNRFLWGEQVRVMPDLTSYMRNEREWFNLQKI